MSEVKLPQVVTLDLPEDLNADQLRELASKFGGWRPMIIALWQGENSLKQQALNQREKVKMPTSIEQISTAEVMDVELGKVITAMKQQRLEMTRPLDKLNERLMEPEKDVQKLRDELKAAILPIKVEHQKREQAKREKEQEVQQLVATIKNYIAQADLEYKSAINRQVTVAYQYALDHDENPETIEAFIEKCSKKLGAADFQLTRPDLKLRLVAPEECEQLLDQHFLCNPHAYAEMYQRELKAKFIDYAVAFKNKADALAIAAKEAEEREKALLEENNRKVLAAQMEASASTTEVTQRMFAKDVKYYYEIEMEETEANAAKIDAQYWANINLTRSKTRASWFKLTIAQKAKALADVKNDDDKFQPEGITFKKTPRL